MMMLNDDVFGHMNAMVSRFDTMRNSMLSSALMPFPSAFNRRTQHSDLSFPFGFSDNGLASDPNCHMFSSRQVMSIAVGPDGRQQVYQASTSTKALPGGVRETQKTVCDSRSGVKKMFLEHRIGERGRVILRQKNLYSGEEEEHLEFINLDQEEAEIFDREFDQRIIMKGMHPLPEVRRSSNKSKASTTLAPEVLRLSAPRFNKSESPQRLWRSLSGKGSNGDHEGWAQKGSKRNYLQYN